jgi:hypothetical protein
MSDSNPLTHLGNLPAARPGRGIGPSDVERAADRLLRQGERPTVEKVRATLGTGSPNTINPLLDAWWKRLSARLDDGPAALHRLPESVAHVAEALWMQALEEGRRRAGTEHSVQDRSLEEKERALEVRSHVLTLREGELESRLKERERAIQNLEEQQRMLTTLLRKEQASRELAQGKVTELEQEIEALRGRLTLVLSKAVQKHRKKTVKSKARAPRLKKPVKRSKTSMPIKKARRGKRRTRYT